jgi:glutathione S-transferase
MTIALDLTRTFDAPMARIFACFTSKEEMSAWMGPYDIRGEVVELDAKVGGAYRIVMHRPDGTDLAVGGVFQAIEEPSRIAFTWKWEDGHANTLIIVTLRDVGGRTEMHFHQEGFDEDVYRDRHIHGWTGCLDKMEIYFSTGVRQDQAA